MFFHPRLKPSLQQLFSTQKYLKICQGQVRQASLIKRPYRPYTFTQLIVLSDGSTFTMRTTSPAPVYKSNKDSRNHPLWQPSSAALRNVEADEAGRLRAFRLRFGHGWDAEEKPDQKNDKKGISSDNGDQSHMGNENNDESFATESLMDLISNASMNASATSSKTDKEKYEIEEDPGEKFVTARNSLGKGVQVKVKDLEQFRKEQKLAKSGGR
ncbi:ribosomal protein [Golovinomyces cichoracearum]|uniref:Ribosomal protein n=1 Tax=Golovinomyces cichoracearum TaxID=62708 RepID=A0A420ILZ5_9PEZI|nr:ribosomal protein [Golovinomyces cichoracearum]